MKPPGTNCAENELGGGSFISDTAFPLSSNTSFDFDLLFAMVGALRTAEDGADDCASARPFAANAAFGLYKRMLLAPSEGAPACRPELLSFTGRSLETREVSSNL